jgi:TolB-like protein/DNA-binding winged helix-turn-helix (wHTH) protein/Tfp pilus assembly protein PilF
LKAGAERDSRDAVGPLAFGPVAFGPFVLDAAERRLTRDGAEVTLPRKAFDLLVLLVEAQGRLQSRDTLIDRLWPDAIVEEHNLTWNTSALRRALGDTGEAPLYIETVRGHGYRFIGDVAAPSAPVAIAVPAPVIAAPADAVTVTAAPRRRHYAAALTLAVVVAAFIAWRAFAPTLPASPPPAHSLAVLPFENLGANPDVAYFASGVQNTIITKLAGIADLKVMSRSSTKSYASHPTDVRAVAAQLHVAAMLEGSVRRAGNEVQVNVQLIDGANARVIWAESYTRALDNVFDIERDIAERVAAALEAKLLSAEAVRVARAPTRDAIAYDRYLRAEHLAEGVGRISVADMTAATREARALYREAIARDPNFALAWARLSYLDAVAWWFDIDKSPGVIADAETASAKALELDPELPQAHLARGYVHYYARLDYDAALAQFDIARRLLPGDGGIGAAIANVQRRQGRLDDALAGYERAATLDPRNSRWPVLLGDTLTMLRRYDDALAAYDRARAIDPANHAPLVYRAMTLLVAGKPALATQTLDETPRGFDPGGVVSAMRHAAAMLERRPDAALAALDAAPAWVEAPFLPSQIPIELLRAQAWELGGDEVRARGAYERARDLLAARLREQPDEPGIASLLGLAQAGLGLTADALANGRRAHEASPIERDAMDAPTYLAALAEIEIRSGETVAAVEHLRQLLRLPAGGVTSAPLVAIDPRYDRVRDLLRASGDIP